MEVDQLEGQEQGIEICCLGLDSLGEFEESYNGLMTAPGRGEDKKAGGFFDAEVDNIDEDHGGRPEVGHLLVGQFTFTSESSSIYSQFEGKTERSRSTCSRGR